MNWKKYIKLLFLSSYFIILGHDVFPHHHHYNCTVIPPKAETNNHCNHNHDKDHDHAGDSDEDHNHSLPDHCHAFNSLKYQNENNYTQIQVFCFELTYSIFDSETDETAVGGLKISFQDIFIKKPLVLNSHNLRAPPCA